jgi:folate-binding protein YgfZ
MNDFLANYEAVRGGTGFHEQKRGLMAVWGKEAVQFLNGLITNDVEKLGENSTMLAAFPNAQGRLLAVVRVLKKDDKFLFETEDATHEKVFQNLFRFTFAGDFFVEDLSDSYRFFSIFGENQKPKTKDQIVFHNDYFVRKDSAENFKNELKKAIEISDELFEVLRIENGVPLYGVDMDETTIVPELDLSDTISYTKGCYIGQEIIARIHFRGHVAKKLTGLILSEPSAVADGLNDLSVAPASAGALVGAEIKSPDGKNAGKITSVIFSPKLQKTIALAFVRYDFLAEGTELKVGEFTATVKDLPFV